MSGPFSERWGRTLASSRVGGRGWPTTYAYDALDRETGRVYRDGSRVTAAFDTAGRRTRMEDGAGITQYASDPADRATGVSYPTGHVLTYLLDGEGNRQVLLDGVQRTTYTWDGLSRLAGIVNPPGERTTVTYDALNRESRKQLANGLTVSHQYDAAGQELVLENRKADGAGVGIYTATYDAAGNRRTVLELDGARVTYAYDAADQLTAEQRNGTGAYDLAYEYDGVGNRLAKVDGGARTASTYNAAHALVRVDPPTGSPTLLTWDGNGNLVQEETGSAVTVYTWDGEDRLLSVAAPGETQVYAYAGDGKRRQKTVGGAVTWFVWDGENVLLEADALLAEAARYTDNPGYWGGLVSGRRSGAARYFAFDPQGSTRLLLDGSGGVTDTYGYTAFGVEQYATGATGNPYRYEGSVGYYRDTAGDP